MNRVHVVVCAYNCPEPLHRCLASIKAQTRQNVTVTVVDDASTDGTVRAAVEAVNDLDGWVGVVNTVRVGATANIWRAVHDRPDPAPDDIIVLVDGDDRLYDATSVESICSYYDADPDGLWLAWGSYVPEPASDGPHPAEAYPAEVIRDASYRSASTLFNHPLTFRAFLFDQVTETDLRLVSGQWVPGIYDEAIMYPMLEVAGPRQACMPDVHYVYNTANPLSCVDTMPDDIAAAAAELRARPPRRRMFRHGDRLRLGADDRTELIGGLAARHGLRFVVETGPPDGALTERLAVDRRVDRAVTIEADYGRYMAAAARLLHTPTVQPLFGPTLDVLRVVAADFPPAVWWLAAEDKPTAADPLLDALSAVLTRGERDVACVDNATACGRRGRPTIDAVAAHVEALRGDYTMAVADDVIVLEPKGTQP